MNVLSAETIWSTFDHDCCFDKRKLQCTWSMYCSKKTSSENPLHLSIKDFINAKMRIHVPGSMTPFDSARNSYCLLCEQKIKVVEEAKYSIKDLTGFFLFYLLLNQKNVCQRSNMEREQLKLLQVFTTQSVLLGVERSCHETKANNDFFKRKRYIRFCKKGEKRVSATETKTHLQLEKILRHFQSVTCELVLKTDKITKFEA